MARSTYVGNSKDIAKDEGLTRPPGVSDHVYPAQSLAISGPPVPVDRSPYLKRDCNCNHINCYLLVYAPLNSRSGSRLIRRQTR